MAAEYIEKNSFDNRPLETERSEALGVLASFQTFEPIRPQRRRVNRLKDLGEVAVQTSDLVNLTGEGDRPSHLRLIARVSMADDDDPSKAYHHSLNFTEPLEGTTAPTVLAFPGLAETTETGVGGAFHDSLAELLPKHRIISIASNGVGNVGDKVGWLDGVRAARISTMAEQRTELVRALVGNLPLVIVATSMGSITTNQMLKENITSKQPLNVAGVGYFAPALVTPEHVPEDVALKFLPYLIADTTLELTTRLPLKEKFRAWKIILGSSLHPKDVPAIAWQVRDILSGTPGDDVEQVLRHYPVAVATGDKDPLGRIWKEINPGEYPNVSVDFIKNRGHGAALIPWRGARKIVRSLQGAAILGRS